MRQQYSPREMEMTLSFLLCDEPAVIIPSELKDTATGPHSAFLFQLQNQPGTGSDAGQRSDYQ